VVELHLALEIDKVLTVGHKGRLTHLLESSNKNPRSPYRLWGYAPKPTKKDDQL
jgi:hypothetical protein